MLAVLERLERDLAAELDRARDVDDDVDLLGPAEREDVVRDRARCRPAIASLDLRLRRRRRRTVDTPAYSKSASARSRRRA